MGRYQICEVLSMTEDKRYLNVKSLSHTPGKLDNWQINRWSLENDSMAAEKLGITPEQLQSYIAQMIFP